MTKSELIAQLAQRLPALTRGDVEATIAEILGALAQAMASRRHAEIRGFGSFVRNYRPARLGRNPKTGAYAPVPGKHTPHFRPGKELREAVDIIAKQEPVRLAA